MILKASQRGGGMQLARHLLNSRDNDHVEVHELRGFVSSSLEGAFKEAYAVSRGTKCTQFLFSLSLNPPETQRVPVEVFKTAIADIERSVGLEGQPRAIVFHEKEGRRHAHCVWSRIDAEKMKAINLPHFKLKLRDMSRELYLAHGWQMPRGLLNPSEPDPLSFTLEQWQQAKRTRQDPRVIKQIFRDCWNRSDSMASFGHALKENGFWLARGDRRGHVAVDWRGEVYAINRWTGIKAKEARARLGDPAKLPSVEKTRALIAERYAGKLREFVDAEIEKFAQTNSAIRQEQTRLVTAHRHSRHLLRKQQEQRAIDEAKARAARLPTGLKALWFRLSGKYRQLCAQNEREFSEAKARDIQERQNQIDEQMRERRALQDELREHRQRHSLTIKKLYRYIGHILSLSEQEKRQSATHQRSRKRQPSR
ncbi:relaxase/mobilization nuclease domain-containing protein [Roseitalea porphyridii]|uniref:Relaxase n=1 Tax=Roseitalea porphyridii TaxID=1852022 RepID=A0A4P6UYC4_9HYPH|nr:relaxase [Roseitalea porphyridii]QBK29775.1 relaxase [Roseitalea porphyridii]